MRICCRLMCAGLIGLSSLPMIGCTSEEESATQFIRSFGKQHYPSEKFFNASNGVTSIGRRWVAVKATGNYGIAIVAINNKQSSAKRTLTKFCTSALSQPFRTKLVKQITRDLSVNIKQKALINLSGGDFLVSNLKRKPIEQIDNFFLTGCEANVVLVNPEKTKLKLQYRLSKYLFEKHYFEDAAQTAKSLLQTKEFVDNATAIIAAAALSLENEGASNYVRKFVHIDLINDPKILLFLSKASFQRGMKNLAYNATNRCLELKPGHEGCLDFQLEISIDEENLNREDISNLENYL